MSNNRFANYNNRNRGGSGDRGGRGRGRGRGGYNNQNSNRNSRGGYNSNRNGSHRGSPRGGRGGNRGNYNGYNNNSNNYRGRGGGGGNRGGGGGGGNCFNCGKPGHKSFECPNGNQSNRGRSNGYNRGGRGGYNRGRGGRDQNRKFKGRDINNRFHETASESLMNDVRKLNECDVSGPQLVEHRKYTNGWEMVESLKDGKFYYSKPDPNNPNKLVNTFKPPKEFQANAANPPKIDCITYVPQGSSFAKPPPMGHYSSHLQSIPIITNSYRIQGAFLNNTVHRYHVDFEPPIHTQMKHERLRALKGTHYRQKRKITDILNEKFGYWAYDNNNLYSMGSVAHRMGKTQLKLTNNHVSVFRWTDSASISQCDMELQEEEQLLNVFKKKIMKKGDFREVRGSAKWFYVRVINPPRELQCIAPTKVTQECTLLHGFECRMGLHYLMGQSEQKDETGKSGIFKADSTNKQVSTKSVHEIIADIGMERMIGSKAFMDEVRSQLVGKFFIMTYSSQSNKIEDVDFKENEKTTFTRRDGIKIGYGQYLKQQYSLDTKLKEICVLKTDGGRCAFLPQFARLTMRSDEVTDTRVTEAAKPGVGVELHRSQMLVQYLNKINAKLANDVAKSQKGKAKNGKDNDTKDDETSDNALKCELRIDERPIESRAVILQYPLITIMGANGEKTTPLNGGNGPSDFKWGGRDGTKGFLGSVVPLKRWVIVANNGRAIDTVYQTWEAYMGMRGFKRMRDPPISPPMTLKIDFKDREQYKKLLRGKYQLIFLIIPEGKFGSEVKVKISNLVTRYKSAKNNGAVVQCMEESTIYDRSARDSMLGAFEQAIGKWGNILYKITPCLSANSPYMNGKEMKNIWMIGIDVSHPAGSNNNRNPSVAMLTLLTLPFCGTRRGMRNETWLNNDRKDIIPFQACASMTYRVLHSFVDRMRKDSKSRPEIVQIYRDGIPDNGLKEVHSKECVGVQRGIKMIAAELKEKFGIVWKPKIQFIICSKDPIDKFGVQTQYGIAPLTEPCVVFRDIASSKLWDFYLWSYYPKADVKKLKPKRYVILKDEVIMNRKKVSKNSAMDCYSIIYALSFTYHSACPFIQGGTSQPSPIKWAKKNAEKFASAICTSDGKIYDLKTSKNIKDRVSVVTSLMDIKVRSSPKKKKEIQSSPIKQPTKVSQTNQTPLQNNQSKPPQTNAQKHFINKENDMNKGNNNKASVTMNSNGMSKAQRRKLRKAEAGKKKNAKK